MIPWKQDKLGLLRNVIRFSLWTCLAVNGVMAAIFSIAFTHQFLRHAWSWCSRELFPGSW